MRKIYSFNKLLLSATATLCFSLANFAQVNFTANPNNGCAPLLVNFTYTGSPSGNYFKWNFGDGDTSILKNPSHTFINPINGPGYNVMLQVWDTTNKSMIYIGQNQMQVQVGGATDFTITSASSCPGEAVNFNFNQGSYNSISWDYGDGSTNNDFWCCPSHIFNNAGTYNVKVTVNTISCGTKMLTKHVVVGNTAKPEFSITANLSQVCINDQVFFSTSYKAASYLWSFGDATTSNQSNPTHSYSTPGNKRVILTATNSCGGTNADTIYVNVLSSGLPINSSFNVFPNPVCPNSAVNFNNNSSGTSYLWDLGDGTISTQRNVSYFYSNSGTYNVRLIVTKGCGNSDTIAQILTVGSGGPNNGKPNIYFQNNNGNSDTIISCPGINVSFGNGNNTNDKTTYLWKFGDGATSTLKYPAHTFTATGLHKIYLVVTNGCGQSDSSNYKYVKIDPNMGNSANLMAIPDSICPGGIVYFFDDDNGSNSTGNIYTIDFGDGTGADNITGPIDSVIGVLAAHVYSTPGSYTYKFYVTNLCGKEDSIVKTITVGVPGPKQPFYFVDNTTSNQNGGGDNSGCPGDAVRFTAVGGITYKWLFGDGKTSTDQIAYHAYADTGTYFAKCVITNACGKTDTVPTTAIIKRTNIPQAYFTTDKSFACSTDSIHFIYQGYQGNDKPNA
ncbi:MAG: PKD domain-containing protein, partial [Bacteroidia bacterium]|nr:PKD domain-containing protein [Bacteroidia bacterium]